MMDTTDWIAVLLVVLSVGGLCFFIGYGYGRAAGIRWATQTIYPETR